MILLDGQITDSLRVVPAAGGELRPATRIIASDHEIGSGWPCFLPDGEHFLFIGTRSDGTAGNIRLGRLGSLDSKLLGQSDGRVEYAPGGWVLFVRGRLAARAEARPGRGQAHRAAASRSWTTCASGTSAGHFSISRERRAGDRARARARPATSCTWPTGSGALESRALATGTLGNPVVLARTAGACSTNARDRPGTPYGDVSVLDLARGTDTRLTFTGGLAVCAVWSPDGRRFAYTRAPRGMAGPRS